jgi:hypothetical protein
VFDQVQSDLAAATIVNERDDSLDLLTAALQQFLDASADNADVQQILLIDGPAVLGWDQWRSLEAEYGLGVITAMLDAAVAQKVIARQPTAPLAHMLLAAVDEAALFIANAPDRRQAHRHANHSRASWEDSEHLHSKRTVQSTGSRTQALLPVRHPHGRLTPRSPASVNPVADFGENFLARSEGFEPPTF